MTEISPMHLSDRLLRVMNPVMRTLIKRGIGSMSREMMVIHWTGRKSGQTRSTPVSRFNGADGLVFTTTPSGWRHNFTDGAPARLQFGREQVEVHGQLVADPDAVTDRMFGVIDDLGLKRGARNLGIEVSGRPDRDEMLAFVAESNWTVVDFTRA